MDDFGARYNPGRSRSSDLTAPPGSAPYASYRHSGPHLPFDPNQRAAPREQPADIGELPNFEPKQVNYHQNNRMYNDTHPFLKSPSPAETAFPQARTASPSSGLSSQVSSNLISVTLIWKKDFGQNVFNTTYIDNSGTSATLNKLPNSPNCFGATVSLSIGKHFGQIDVMEDELLETIDFVVEPFNGRRQQILLNLKNPKMSRKADVPSSQPPSHPLQNAAMKPTKSLNNSNVEMSQLQEVIDELKRKNQALKQETIKLDEDLIRKIEELTDWEKYRDQLNQYERENAKLKDETHHLEQQLNEALRAKQRNKGKKEEVEVKLADAEAEITQLNDSIGQFEREKQLIIGAKDLEISNLIQEHKLQLSRKQTSDAATNVDNYVDDISTRFGQDLQQTCAPELFQILPRSGEDASSESEFGLDIPVQVQEPADVAVPDPTIMNPDLTEIRPELEDKSAGANPTLVEVMENTKLLTGPGQGGADGIPQVEPVRSPRDGRDAGTEVGAHAVDPDSPGASAVPNSEIDEPEITDSKERRENPSPNPNVYAIDLEYGTAPMRSSPNPHTHPVKFNQRPEGDALKKDSKSAVKKKNSFKTKVNGVEVYLQGISSTLDEFINKEVCCRLPNRPGYETGILRVTFTTKVGAGKTAHNATLGGIEFEDQLGSSDGFYKPDGKQYFKTPPGCAVFVEIVDIKVKVKPPLIVESTSL